MITINSERCNGCGACIEVCPSGALYLVEGLAAVDNTLCRDCEACIAACPTDALMLVSEGSAPEPDMPRVPALRPEPEVIYVKSQPAPVPTRSRLLPVMGSLLAWAGREIVPWLADYFLHDRKRQPTGRQTGASRLSAPNGDSRTGGGRNGRRSGRGSGGRRRRRRRGS
jgi:NAD-dependent dihydropyrimidine dehydrogenase PreA subunit